MNTARQTDLYINATVMSGTLLVSLHSLHDEPLLRDESLLLQDELVLPEAMNAATARCAAIAA